MRVRHPNRKKLPHYPITACRFREARLQVGMGIEACANLLRVSERSIRGWESGETRIPYAAYKLLRVLKGGRYLAHPIWKDFVVQGDVLVTPEGHRFQAGELGWWSLLIRQARAFRDVLRERREREAAKPEPLGSAAGQVAPLEQQDTACGTVVRVRPLVRAGGESRRSIGSVDQNRGFSPVTPVALTPYDQASLSAIGPRSNTGQKRVLFSARGVL